jgi:uncharacterized iron-regulated membrane protein
MSGTIGLYARVWRWHFFAALVVIPFVLWQSVTGVLYLWRDDFAQIAHPELMRVAPADQTVSLDDQLASVLKHQSRDRLTAIEISDDASRSTAFFFRADNGLPYPAFVNPHSGEYLGSVESTHWLAGLTRALHGGWPIQPYGSYLLELGASWAIVMTLTGLYLWWPRNANGLAGVLYPRLRAGSRVFWRDLHSTVGVYFALIFLSFLFTALPWTTFWGEQVLARVEKAAGQQAPNGFFFASGSDHHHASAPGEHAGHVGHEAPHAIGLDDLVANARAAGARGKIELHPTMDGSSVNIRDQHPRAPDEVWLQLDGRSGAVLTRVVWEDFPVLPRVVSLGVDLHEGTFFGRANQVFNTLVALALVWLSVTGFIGWYKRRPSSGGLAAPPRRDVRVPAAVLSGGALLCVLLPLLGASVLAIAILDSGLGRLLPSRGNLQ